MLLKSKILNCEKAGLAPLKKAYLIIVPFLILCFIWSAFAPLSSAAIASGKVVFDNERKTIQHLEGGIVSKILVREGQNVSIGQPLAIIRDVSQRANLEARQYAFINEQVRLLRLIAERDGHSSLNLSKISLPENLNPSILNEIKTSQSNLFKNRQTTLQTKKNLIQSRKITFQKEIEARKARLAALKENHKLTSEELKTTRQLLEKKLSVRQRVVELKTDKVELEGSIGQERAEISRIEENIIGADIEKIDVETEMMKEVLENIQKSELEVQRLSHEINEMSDKLERTTVRSPNNGRAMDLQIHTKGAVVQPGQRILDIAPDDDRLIIEARVKPENIDLVKNGAKADIALTAYSTRNLPKISGKILDITGDSLTDENIGEQYYLARIQADEDIINQFKQEITLYPGMPAQIFLIAGKRTLLDYLIDPIKSATDRAFREN